MVGDAKLMRVQIEYYFSEQNLAKDQYLVAHMDSKRLVPVSLLLSFRRVRALMVGICGEQAQAELLIDACRVSDKLLVDCEQKTIGPCKITLNVHSEPYHPQPQVTPGIMGVRFSAGTSETSKFKQARQDLKEHGTGYTRRDNAYADIVKREWE